MTMCVLQQRETERSSSLPSRKSSVRLRPRTVAHGIFLELPIFLELHVTTMLVKAVTHDVLGQLDITLLAKH
jgi:hypothetical protein